MSRKMNYQSILLKFFPFMIWLKDYKTAFLKHDIIAGLSVSIVLIPQSMAYAMLAGMPPVYGLYAAAITPLIGAMWGSLRQLSTGPIAIMSLLVLTTISPLAEPGSPQYIELAILLSLMVGVFYLIIGLFKMGIVMSFISHSSVKGFTSAASLIIMSTQLPHLLGIKPSHEEYVIPKLIDVAKGIPDIHLTTLLIGISAVVLIYSLRKINKAIPSGLIAIVLTTAAIVLFDLDKSGVPIVGFTPSGFPLPKLPMFDFGIISDLIGPAIIIALVSFVETFSVSQAISSKTKQKTNVNQEFIGQGLANLVGSFFNSYPVSGSISRTALNYSSGAKTGVSSIVNSISVILAILFLTPLFTYIPKAALAAMVITAVLVLFHPKEVFVLVKKSRDDGIVAMTVFILALVTKPDYALLIGIFISLAFFLWKIMHPRIVHMTRDPKLKMIVNADDHDVPSCPQIMHIRPDNSIFFANAEYTMDHIMDEVKKGKQWVKYVLLDFGGVAFIDISGIEELSHFKQELSEMGITLAIMDLHKPVRKTFDSSGFTRSLDPGCYIKNRMKSFSILFRGIDHDYCKIMCPHVIYEVCKTAK